MQSQRKHKCKRTITHLQIKNIDIDCKYKAIQIKIPHYTAHVKKIRQNKSNSVSLAFTIHLIASGDRKQVLNAFHISADISNCKISCYMKHSLISRSKGALR